MRFMKTTLVAFALLVVTGCTPGTAPDAATLAADAALAIGTSVASDICPGAPCGFTRIYMDFKLAYPKAVKPADDAQVQAILASVTSTGGLLEQLKLAASAADQATDVRGIESALNQVLNIVSNDMATIPSIPPQYTIGFMAVSALIIELEATANRISPTTKAGVVATPARFDGHKMSVTQARAVLHGQRG